MVFVKAMRGFALAALLVAFDGLTSQVSAFEHVFHRGFNGTLTYGNKKFYGGENSVNSLLLMNTRKNSANNAKYYEVDSKSDGLGFGWAINPINLGKSTNEFSSGKVQKTSRFDPWYFATTNICTAAVQSNCAVDAGAQNKNLVNNGLLVRRFLLKKASSRFDFHTLAETLQSTEYIVLMSTYYGDTVFVDVKGWNSIKDTEDNLGQGNPSPNQTERIVFEIEPRDINPAIPWRTIRSNYIYQDSLAAGWDLIAVARSLTWGYGFRFLINAPESGAVDATYQKIAATWKAGNPLDIASWIYDGAVGRAGPGAANPEATFWGWNMLHKYVNPSNRFDIFSTLFKTYNAGHSFPNVPGGFIMEWKPGIEAYGKIGGPGSAPGYGGINRDGSCCYPIDGRGTVADKNRTNITHLTYDEPDGPL